MKLCCMQVQLQDQLYSHHDSYNLIWPCYIQESLFWLCLELVGQVYVRCLNSMHT